MRPDASFLIPLERDGRIALQTQVAGHLRRAIATGALPADLQMPASRKLADDLGISRTTVLEAYAQLESEGLLVGRRGRGTFVSRNAPGQSAPVPGGTPPARSLSHRGVRLRDATVTFTSATRPIGAFRSGLPDVAAFPKTTWARLVAKALRSSDLRTFDYQPAHGYRPLRETIAQRVLMTRGIRCDPDQVIVVDGVQQAVELIAQIFIDAGDLACVEDPGFLGWRGSLAAAGARLVAIAVDGDGATIPPSSATAPRLMFVSPSHQFPTGVTMSAQRRQALLDWSEHTGATIVEDDFENEFCYFGRPLAAIASLDVAGRVIYTSSFSKTMFPAIRLGYVIVPPDLVDVFRAARAVAVRSGRAAEQIAAAEFIASGELAKHVRHMRARYAQRQSVLIEQVRKQLGTFVTIEPAKSGIHLLARFIVPIDDRAVTRAAAARGIDAAPLTAHALQLQPRGGLLLGYAAVSAEEIPVAVKTLALAVDDVVNA